MEGGYEKGELLGRSYLGDMVGWDEIETKN